MSIAGEFGKRVREKEKREVQVAPIPDVPFLTKEEAAACLGVTRSVLENWVYEGVIPRPRKWGKKRPFRKTYVEVLRNLLVIRASTPGMRFLEEFGKLCRKNNLLWGHR